MTATRPLAAPHLTKGHPAYPGALLGLVLFLVLSMASACDSSEAAGVPGAVGGDLTPAQAPSRSRGPR